MLLYSLASAPGWIVGSVSCAQKCENNENKLGIQFCGTGNGINMSANKHQGIRAALCWNTHIAEQSRLHNNANILTMPRNGMHTSCQGYDARTKKRLMRKLSLGAHLFNPIANLFVFEYNLLHHYPK